MAEEFLLFQWRFIFTNYRPLTYNIFYIFTKHFLHCISLLNSMCQFNYDNEKSLNIPFDVRFLITVSFSCCFALNDISICVRIFRSYGVMTNCCNIY